MICQNTDFILQLNADFLRSIWLIDEVTGDPIDLTGATAVLAIRKTVGGTLVDQISVGSGITITALEGRTDLRFTAAETAAFSTTGIKQRSITEYATENLVDIVADGYAAYYALEVTYSGGVIERILDGYMCLKPGGVD